MIKRFITTLLFCLLFASAVFVPAQAHPASGTSKPTGQIVFVSDRDGNNEIYLMNADGSDPVNLTNNPADDEAPVWSPDGKQIAFLSDRDSQPTVGTMSIYLLDVESKEIRRLLDDGYAITNEDYAATGSPLSWSPDGKLIAVAASAKREDGMWDTAHIYTLEPSTGTMEQISNETGHSPVWSSDGEFVAYPGGYLDRFWDFGIARIDKRFEVRISYSKNDDLAYPSDIYENSEYYADIQYMPGEIPYEKTYIVTIVDRSGHRARADEFIFEQNNNVAHVHVKNEKKKWRVPDDRLTQNGWTLSAEQQDGNWELYATSTIKEHIRLTKNKALDGSPAWRPLSEKP
jgi:dipeptidyl aminopeptidase/acylaminoacyl peptidase